VIESHAHARLQHYVKRLAQERAETSEKMAWKTTH